MNNICKVLSIFPALHHTLTTTIINTAVSYSGITGNRNQTCLLTIPMPDTENGADTRENKIRAEMAPGGGV